MAAGTLEQRLDRVSRNNSVRIQEQQRLPDRHVRSDSAAARESVVNRPSYHPSDRQSGACGVGGAVPRRIVHDDHFYRDR
jgi:hypothetical protein